MNIKITKIRVMHWLYRNEIDLLLAAVVVGGLIAIGGVIWVYG